MKIMQIINNNVIVSEDFKGNEVILVGKGIGFNGKKGQPVDESKVLKIFTLLNDEEKLKTLYMVEEIPYEVIAFGVKACNYIVECSSKKISRKLLVPLIDHIYTTIERTKEGLSFDNRILFNVKFLYPEEYHTAVDILDMLESDFGISVDRSEASFIALHILNAELDIDMKDTYKATNIIDLSVRTVEEFFEVKLKEDINLARFITHLEFFAKRMIQNTMNDENDKEMDKYINLRFKKEYECAKIICGKIEQEYGWNVDPAEYSYLAIHIARLLR